MEQPEFDRELFEREVAEWGEKDDVEMHETQDKEDEEASSAWNAFQKQMHEMDTGNTESMEERRSRKLIELQNESVPIWSTHAAELAEHLKLTHGEKKVLTGRGPCRIAPAYCNSCALVRKEVIIEFQIPDADAEDERLDYKVDLKNVGPENNWENVSNHAHSTGWRQDIIIWDHATVSEIEHNLPYDTLLTSNVATYINSTVEALADPLPRMASIDQGRLLPRFKQMTPDLNHSFLQIDAVSSSPSYSRIEMDHTQYMRPINAMRLQEQAVFCSIDLDNVHRGVFKKDNMVVISCAHPVSVFATYSFATQNVRIAPLNPRSKIDENMPDIRPTVSRATQKKKQAAFQHDDLLLMSAPAFNSLAEATVKYSFSVEHPINPHNLVFSLGRTVRPISWRDSNPEFTHAPVLAGESYRLRLKMILYYYVLPFSIPSSIPYLTAIKSSDEMAPFIDLDKREELDEAHKLRAGVYARYPEGRVQCRLVNGRLVDENDVENFEGDFESVPEITVESSTNQQTDSAPNQDEMEVDQEQNLEQVEKPLSMKAVYGTAMED